MDVENGGDGKVSCKVAPYCQVLILGISRNQPINHWCMKTIQSIHHENNLRDLEIRLFFHVYVQIPERLEILGITLGNLADTFHLGWQTSERLQTTDCLKSVGGSFC